MKRSGHPAFKKTRWYKPLFVSVFVMSLALAIWVLRSGALAMWDRYSPESTTGPVLPWLLALPIGLLGGAVVALLIMMQLELVYERWRDRAGL